MSTLHETGLLVVTYLWGSVPAGYLLTKLATGKNILELGSGNVGSTNVRRVAGKKWSLITQLFDMLKGLLPVALFLLLNNQPEDAQFVYLLALAAILGHDFSLFLKFRGGKGVNTTLGASLLLAPVAVLIAVALYFLVKWKYQYVSLGSIVLAISLPLTEMLMHGLSLSFYYLLACSLLIIVLHRKNIIRLLNGNELRA